MIKGLSGVQSAAATVSESDSLRSTNAARARSMSASCIISNIFPDAPNAFDSVLISSLLNSTVNPSPGFAVGFQSASSTYSKLSGSS